MTLLSADVQKEKLAPVFLPSVLFPSQDTAQSNFAAWRTFWNKDRVTALKRDLDTAARENGFAPNAFEPFWKIIHQENPGNFRDTPKSILKCWALPKRPEGYTQLSLLAAGKNYNAEDFFDRLSPKRSG